MRFSRFETLEQLCLSTITDNLEKFIYNKEVPQMHINFLFRIHASEIFNRFSSEHKISETAMLWFLNKYSQTIHLSILSENIIKQLKKMGSTVTCLNLKNSLATVNMINSILCCVPNIIELNLSFSNCQDKTLLCISKLCPKVKILNLRYCSITDQGMINLCGSNLSLKALNLEETLVTKTGLSIILKGMPLLECLKFYNFSEIFHQIHTETMQEKEIFSYNLTELLYERSGKSRASDVLHTWISLCPNLTKVFFYFAITYKELILCSRIKSLKILRVSSPPGMMTNKNRMLFEDNSDVDFPSILAPFMLNDNLTILILSYNEIPTKELIEGFKSLQTLSLRNVTFTDFSDDLKPHKNKIEKLVLKNISMSELKNYKAVLKLLTVCKNVLELQLCSTKVVPLEIFEAILNSMDCLVNVDFSFTPITIQTVVKFFQHPHLKTFCLDGCWNISSVEELNLLVHVQMLKANTKANTLAWCLNYDDDFLEDSDDSLDQFFE